MFSRAVTLAADSVRSLLLVALAAALCIGYRAVSYGANVIQEHSGVKQSGPASPAARPKRVLLMFGEDQHFPMMSTLEQSIQSTLHNRSANWLEFYTERLDRTRISDAVYEREMVNMWEKKYEDRRLDLIIVCIASALDLLSRRRAEVFSGAPTVFCVLFEQQRARIQLPSDATGVWSASPFRPTLDLALKSYPDTRHVIVVYGSSDFEKGVLEITKTESHDFEANLDITYLTDLTISEFQARLASLPARQSHRLRILLTEQDISAALPQDVSLYLYRIAQDCLNNVVRHSGAQEARVLLRGTAKSIRLRVEDSGSGFDIKSPRVMMGLGLLSMRERLRLVGGSIAIVSHPSQGTQIEASVPLRPIGIEIEGNSQDEKTGAADCGT